MFEVFMVLPIIIAAAKLRSFFGFGHSLILGKQTSENFKYKQS